MWRERQTDLHLQIYTLGLQLSIHKLHAGHIITIIIFITRHWQFSEEEEKETWGALWEEEAVAFFYLLTSMPCHGIQEIQSTDYIVVIIMQRHANTFTHGFQACKVNYSIESSKQSIRGYFFVRLESPKKCPERIWCPTVKVGQGIHKSCLQAIHRLLAQYRNEFAVCTKHYWKVLKTSSNASLSRRSTCKLRVLLLHVLVSH